MAKPSKPHRDRVVGQPIDRQLSGHVANVGPVSRGREEKGWSHPLQAMLTEGGKGCRSYLHKRGRWQVTSLVLRLLRMVPLREPGSWNLSERVRDVVGYISQAGSRNMTKPKRDAGVRQQWNPASATHCLCDLGHITECL